MNGSANPAPPRGTTRPPTPPSLACSQYHVHARHDCRDRVHAPVHHHRQRRCAPPRTRTAKIPAHRAADAKNVRYRRESGCSPSETSTWIAEPAPGQTTNTTISISANTAGRRRRAASSRRQRLSDSRRAELAPNRIGAERRAPGETRIDPEHERQQLPVAAEARRRSTRARGSPAPRSCRRSGSGAARPHARQPARSPPPRSVRHGATNGRAASAARTRRRWRFPRPATAAVGLIVRPLSRRR